MEPIQAPSMPGNSIFGRLMRLTTVERKVVLIDPMNVISVQEFRNAKNQEYPDDAKSYVQYLTGQAPNQQLHQILVRTEYPRIRELVRAKRPIYEILIAWRGQEDKGQDKHQFVEGDRRFLTREEDFHSIEETQWTLADEGEEGIEPSDCTIVRTGVGLYFTLDSADTIQKRFESGSVIDYPDDNPEEPKTGKGKKGGRKPAAKK